ncbi:MAG TPA: glycosyl transferase [Acetobacteraceae bacterium]|jgi:GT2 family glycosyltransferase|nr:glycosyl transferase [Acetobacteraceae bacterium]
MPARDTGAEPAVVTLARTAMARGMAAIAGKDTVAALRWLERARRLVPKDPNIALALASLYLNDDPDRAESLFATVARDHDVQQAWLGLAAVRFRAGNPAAAAEPLASALSRHAFIQDVTMLADRIAPAGWCALRPEGALEIHAPPGVPIKVTLDGKTAPGTRLPEDWVRGRTVEVVGDGAPLLGSPIQVGAIRHVDGCVEVWEGGLRGWAWHPNDPATDPVLTLTDGNGRQRTITPSDESIAVADTGPLARPRSFSLTAADLRDLVGPIRVSGPNGRDLTGSPVDPHAEGAFYSQVALGFGREHPANGVAGPALRVSAPVPFQPVGADNTRRATTVVIPIHNGGPIVLACLASVLASVSKDVRVLVIDDGSTDPAIVAAIDDLHTQRKIGLHRHARAEGFPVSANAGIRLAKGRDVVLLNSDTLVPPGWVERLRAAAYAEPDIGSVTPLSNDASIVSYPGPAGTNERPNQAATNRLDRLAARANGSATVDIPVGVGFCLYLRRDCLNAVGAFRTDVFAQGYGEENDLCLRARRLGWRNVALTGLFVGHHAGTTFGPSAVHLRRRNSRLLEELHPGYDALVARYVAADPLAQARRRIDSLIWKERGRKWPQAAILIAHDDGGGVERQVRHRAAAHAADGRRPIVLRPAETNANQPAIAVRDGLNDDLPNLIFAMPTQLPELAGFLRASRADRIEAHHLADYGPEIYDLIAKLALPCDVHVHDYAWFCPRISLVAAYNRYCGEPDLADCEACIADNGHFLKEDISVEALRRRSDRFLADARQIVVPAADVGRRLRRYFPEVTTTTVPHEDDGDTAPPRKPAARPNGRPRVCVVGAIGIHKGYEILLACARDAQRRDLDLEFAVVGHTIDDARIMATERVFVTGEFGAGEAVALIAAQNAALGFVPSIWPETWCLTLGEIWRAGLSAAAFDIGAPAERIRQTGRGIVLPLGLSPNAINNALLAAVRAAGL